MERVLSSAYLFDWPARVAHGAGLQRRLRVVRHAVIARAWPADLRTLRIAFASDFHAGPTTHPSIVEQACRALAAARPDVLLLGGDYVLFHARYIDRVARSFAEVPATHGRYAVMGNHDLWADDARIARALERAGIEVLVNREVRLPAPFDHVSIYGMDDPWTGDARARDATVLLMHAPSGLLVAKESTFDVAFCGHTHGGQIALPGGVPVLAPGPLSRAYNSGRFDLARGTLIVSRGVGCGELPIRTFADADVIVCELGGVRAR
jgi:predicted MPP superfamily phosphohydrolase